VKVTDADVRECVKELAYALRITVGAFARVECRPETFELKDRVERIASAIDERLKDSK
jgi:hypothetical protein